MASTMAWSLAHAKLHILLRQRGLLPPNSRILIAVSGGQDSLCLARLLIDMQPRWQWSLAIMHCDHRWREDSADNAAYVLNLSEAWQVPVHLAVASTALTSEAAARKWRYETFANVAREQGYLYVVTGHTASDRAETVLYNLIRGTGLDGIGTLSWQRSIDGSDPGITLVRPLLTFARSETEQVCQQQSVRVWQDSSNQDLRFRRNRIRQELLPYLREHFNPQVEKALAQTAEITAADTDYLEAQASAVFTQTVFTQTVTSEPHHPITVSMPMPSMAWSIDSLAIQAQPLALQRRVIRQMLQQAMSQPPSFQHVDKLIAMLNAPHGSFSDPFPGGLIAQVRKPYIWLYPHQKIS